MADKNITLRQKNTSGVYDKLYTKTTATQSKLSAATAALFGEDISDADAALAKIADTVKDLGYVVVKVVDQNGNPIQGAKIIGLYDTPITNSDGIASARLQESTITVSSPYIDLQDKTIDVSSYVGSLNKLIITLQTVGENNIKRLSSSVSAKFSKMIKSIDVCCVGGGGSGGGLSQIVYSGIFGGGGGGGIVNSIGITPQFAESYSIIVGSGGTYNHSSNGSSGGTSSFGNLLTASGGGGGTLHTGGSAGATGCGVGGGDGNGQSNTTISEFGDNLTFYSGGGGSGSTSNTVPSGGSPNGASGSTIQRHGIDAGVAGIGGGGGGASGLANDSSNPTYWSYQAKGSAGGPGLVAIRFHF